MTIIKILHFPWIEQIISSHKFGYTKLQMPHSIRYGICSKLCTPKNLSSTIHVNHPLPINLEKRESLLLWGSRSQPLREKDWVRRRRSDGSERQWWRWSEREWEWEWEGMRDWERWRRWRSKRDWEWELCVFWTKFTWVFLSACDDGHVDRKETESNEFGFLAYKSGPMNLISGLCGHSGHLNYWQNKKPEYNILDFITQNRLLWTRMVKNQIYLKRFLTRFCAEHMWIMIQNSKLGTVWKN